MAFSTKVLLSLVTLLILATSQAQGLEVTGVNMTALTLNVGLRCQGDPAAPGSGNTPPLTDATVTLMMDNGEAIASANTDLDGRATITINNANPILMNMLRNWNIGIKTAILLPIVSCPDWAHTNGALVGPVVQVGSPVGGVLNLTVNTMRFVAQ